MDDTTTMVRLILASGRVLSAADHVKRAYNTQESFIQLHNDLGHILYSFNRFLDDLYSSAGSGPLQQWFANKYPQGCLDALAEMEARLSGIDSTTRTVNGIHSTVEYFDQHRALFQALLDTRESPKKSHVASILMKDGTSAHPNESQDFEVHSREESISDFGTGPNESLANSGDSADPERPPDGFVGQSDYDGQRHSTEGPETPPQEHPAGLNQQNRPRLGQLKKFRPRELFTRIKARGFPQRRKNEIPLADTCCDVPLQTGMVVDGILDDPIVGETRGITRHETSFTSGSGSIDEPPPPPLVDTNKPLDRSWSDLLCCRG